MIYSYDFGDDWRHRVVPVSNRPLKDSEPMPRFLDGAWATPPEDIGGPPGYKMFRQARPDETHPRHHRAQHAGYVDRAPDDIHRDASVEAFAELQGQKRRAPNPWMAEG